MGDQVAQCWLCGRDIQISGGADLLPHSGIPIHRECLEDGSRLRHRAPLNEPGDVIYLSAALFRT